MNTITILIAAIVAAAISIVFRKLDKENSTMDKVRRYADKRQTEFDTYFQEQSKKLEASSAELETTQLQAVAAIKRLENEKNSFLTQADEFQKYKNIIAAAEKKLNDYDSSLSELNEMTANVEENLNRLKKESLVVDKLDQKIVNQKKNIDELEKKIPQVSSDFSKKNAEQLKILGTKLLDEYDARTKQVEANIAISESKAEDVLAKFREEIANVYGTAAKKVQDLEDVAFKQLSERAEQRSTAYVHAMESKVSKLADEIDKKLSAQYSQFVAKYNQKTTETDSAIMNRYKDLLEKAKQLSQKTDLDLGAQYKALDEKYKQRALELDATLSKKTNELNTTLEKKTSETVALFKDTSGNVIANIKKSLSSLDEKYNQHIADFSKKYDEKINSMQGKYESKLNAIDGTNDSRIAELDKKFTEKFNQSDAMCSQKLEQLDEQVSTLKTVYSKEENSLLSDINARIKQIGEQCAKEIENVRTDLNDSLLETKHVSDFLSQNVQGNSKALDQLKASLDTQIQDVEARYTNLFANAVSDADKKEHAAFEKFTQAANETVEKYHSNLKSKIENMKLSLSETLREVSTQADESVREAEQVIKQLQNECDEAQRRADSIEPKLTEKVQAVDKTIAVFREKAEERLNDFDRFINEAIRKMSEQCEIRQSDALKAIDSQLGSYKKDLAYQFNRLETSGKDVDSLENSLRNAIEDVRLRVLQDFEVFSKEQVQTQENFANSIKKDSESIERQLQDLESQIEELKQSAVVSVKTKLKDFEDSFSDDLITRNAKIDEDLATWKNSFEGKLALFASDYEKARRDIEVKHNDALQKKLGALQEKNNEQIARVSANIQDTKKSINDELKEIAIQVAKFSEDTQKTIDTTRSNSDEHLKTIADDYEQKMNTHLKKVQSSVVENMRSFRDDINEKQETSVATIDAALAEITAWKTRLKQQLDEANALFNDQLDVLKESSQNKISQTRETLESDFMQYANKIQMQQDELLSNVEQLQQQTDKSIEDYERQSKDIVLRLQKMYEDMLRETETKVGEQSKEAAEKLSTLRNRMNELEEKTSQQQTQFVLKMQNDANEFQSHISELNRELQNVRSQMQIYDQAENMKEQLDEKIADLTESFRTIALYNKTAKELIGQYNNIVKIHDYVKDRSNDIDSQKNRVDTVAQKFDKLIGLSEVMDGKIQELNTTYDQLQNMELAARDFQEKLVELSASYDRLEQKQDVLDHVTNDVNTSFENLKSLETGLKACEKQLNSLPKEIKLLQTNVDKILKNGPKIAAAAEKLDDLHSLLDDADKRVKVINSAREGLGRSEARLEELNADIDAKFKLLGQITKKDLEKNPTKGETRLSPRDTENIRTLKRQGWTIAQIAKRMNRTQTEVSLALELSDD